MSTTIHRHYVDRILVAVRAELGPDESALLGLLIEAQAEDDLTAEDLIVMLADELAGHLDRSDPDWYTGLLREEARIAKIRAKAKEATSA